MFVADVPMTEMDGELMEELISAESKCNVTSLLSVVNKKYRFVGGRDYSCFQQTMLSF
jgi:hypothetical protein